MTTYYVNKSGSDSNDGLSHDTAFLTINKGIVWMGSYPGTDPKLFVGSGVYNEGNIYLWRKHFYDIIADGFVVIDGLNSFNGFFSHNTNMISLSKATIKSFIFKNFISHAFDLGGWHGNITFEDCIFDNCGIALKNLIYYCKMKRCICINSQGFATFFDSASYGMGHEVINCSMYNLSADAIHALGLINASLKNNIFQNCANCIRIDNASFTLGSNYNNFFNCTKIGEKVGTDYTTLAAWQALGYDLNSTEYDPKFISAPNCLFGLDPTSQCNTAGEYGISQGAKFEAGAKAVGDDLAGWHPDSNVGYDATNKYWYLTSGTSGKITSPVYDLGSVRRIGKIFTIGAEDYPLLVRDLEISDSKPNRRNMEIRYSDISFLWNDVSPAWVTFERFQNINDTGRYFQLRETLRLDGVAA